MVTTNISNLTNNNNVSENEGEGEANFNKKQFWSYQRLYEKSHGGSKKNKNINNSNSHSNSNSNLNLQSKSKNNNNNKNNKNNTNTKKRFHLVNNKIATDKELVKRLDSIYIPPMYKDLVVAKSPKNKIQAIGTDSRGRRQYVYNHKYTKKRNDRKYDFIVPLGKKIIQIEHDNEIALNTLSSKPYNKWILPDDYIPIIIYMLRTYHFRIGNEKYANDNNSYGITTLKKEHIKFEPSHKKSKINSSNNVKFTIEFVGKKGILNKFSDTNSKSNIIKILKTLIENASSDGYLFKYYQSNNSNNSGQGKHNEAISQFITPEHIHSFFQTKYNSEITPKMFRTWYGNYHMINHLKELFDKGKLKPKMTKSEINHIITNCSEHVSSKLNNTPTVSKQSYIDNKILDLVIKNPYRFASKIPSGDDAQHKFLFEIILKLRHL